MSAIRNSVPQRQYKERSQPSSRKRFGLLEKHKDYVERSRDYHKKQDFVNLLRRKAEFKNPDEYYYAMHNSKLKEGIHTEIPHSSLSHDMTQVLKDQDMSYITYKKAVNDSRLERLQQSNHLNSGNNDYSDAVGPKHTIFVDDQAEADEFDPHDYFQVKSGNNEMLRRKHNRLRQNQPEPDQIDLPESVISQRNHITQEIHSRKARSIQLKQALEFMRNKKSLATSKGASIKKFHVISENDSVDDKGRPVFVWKPVRMK